MMGCCLLDSKAWVMVLPRHFVTWLGPHEADSCCQSRSRRRACRSTTSLVNAKQKLLRSQLYFQHTSPRPTNFNVVWPKLLYNESFHCRIWFSTLKLGGGGPSASQVFVEMVQDLMCSCETSLGSTFLYGIGPSVDGAPVVWA